MYLVNNSPSVDHFREIRCGCYTHLKHDKKSTITTSIKPKTTPFIYQLSKGGRCRATLCFQLWQAIYLGILTQEALLFQVEDDYLATNHQMIQEFGICIYFSSFLAKLILGIWFQRIRKMKVYFCLFFQIYGYLEEILLKYHWLLLFCKCRSSGLYKYTVPYRKTSQKISVTFCNLCHKTLKKPYDQIL